jgi:hypothetical protein
MPQIKTDAKELPTAPGPSREASKGATSYVVTYLELKNGYPVVRMRLERFDR